MKKNIYSLALICILCGLSSCGLYRKRMTVKTFEPLNVKSAPLEYTPIKWTSDSIGNKWNKHAALFIPASINGTDRKFYFQLDLGIPTTRLYGNTLKSFIDKYPNLASHQKAAGEHSFFQDATITLNKHTSLIASKLPVISFGKENIDSSFTIMGSFGYDFLGENILILDFKQNRYALTDALSEEMKQKTSFIKKPDLDKFPVILPMKLGKKNIRVMYDSGSSMFPILTGNNRLQRLTKKKHIDSLCCISSWGNNYPIYHTKNKKEITINNHSHRKEVIYGFEKLNKLAFTGKYLYGITGNKLFLNKIIIIDRKNNQFGIIY